MPRAGTCQTSRIGKYGRDFSSPLLLYLCPHRARVGLNRKRPMSNDIRRLSLRVPITRTGVLDWLNLKRAARVCQESAGPAFSLQSPWLVPSFSPGFSCPYAPSSANNAALHAVPSKVFSWFSWHHHRYQLHMIRIGCVQQNKDIDQ